MLALERRVGESVEINTPGGPVGFFVKAIDGTSGAVILETQQPEHWPGGTPAAALRRGEDMVVDTQAGQIRIGVIEIKSSNRVRIGLNAPRSWRVQRVDMQAKGA